MAVTVQQRAMRGAQLLYEFVQEEITKLCSTELLPALCDPHREILAALPTAFEDLLSFGEMCRRFFEIYDRGHAAVSTWSEPESISFLAINTFCKVVLDSVEVQARLGAALASPDSEAEELANQCRFVVVWTRTFCAVGDSTKCARLCSGLTVFQLIDAMPLLEHFLIFDREITTWSQKAIPITILEGDEEMTYTFPELLATIREGRT